MVGGAEIAIALPGIAHVALLLLKKITETVQKYHTAETAVREKVVIFNGYMIQLQLELEEFGDISPDLPQDLLSQFESLFLILVAKLEALDAELDSLLKKGTSLKITVVFSSIDKSIKEIDSWHRRIVDFFELLTRFPKPFIDVRKPNPATALGRVRIVNEAIFAATENTPTRLELGADQVPAGLEQLPSCTAYVPQTGEKLVVEIKKIDSTLSPAKVALMKDDVIDLARILSAEDIATRGILHCKGYRHDEPNNRFQLIFNIPDNLAKPRSLRDILTDRDFKDQVKHPLNERLSLAKQLARAVLHVHSKKHVHKNIRPETILLFETTTTTATEGGRGQGPGSIGNSKSFPVSLGQVFLTGFDRIRKDEADTIPITDTTWTEDIYRHPTRQGPANPDTKFSMLHDIYSLGVIFLEIALWRSFIINSPAQRKIVNRKACDLMEPGLPTGLQRMRSPRGVQEKFLRDARSRIAAAMGERFRDVVVRCLGIVEEEEGSGEGVFLGVRYINTVLSELEEIVL